MIQCSRPFFYKLINKNFKRRNCTFQLKHTFLFTVYQNLVEFQAQSISVQILLRCAFLQRPKFFSLFVFVCMLRMLQVFKQRDFHGT